MDNDNSNGEKAMTIAEEISALFDDDGMAPFDCDVITIDEACSDRRATNEVRNGDSIRYDFSDGSSIVTVSGAWDFGMPDSDCHCWLGAGHHDDCQRIPVEVCLTKHPFEVVENCMDPELRDEVHLSVAPCTAQMFVDAYCARHEQEFGESFDVN